MKFERMKFKRFLPFSVILVANIFLRFNRLDLLMKGILDKEIDKCPKNTKLRRD